MKRSLVGNREIRTCGFDSTYEGLKLRAWRGRVGRAVGFDSTYEGLKRLELARVGTDDDRFDSTYEGLKRVTASIYAHMLAEFRQYL